MTVKTGSSAVISLARVAQRDADQLGGNLKTDNSLTQMGRGYRLNIDKPHRLGAMLRHVAGLATLLLSAQATALEPIIDFQPHHEIIAAAEQHALSVATANGLSSVSVRTKRLDPRLRLAGCDRPLTTFDNLIGPISRNIAVGVTCESAKPWKLYVPVQVFSKSSVIRLSRSLGRGEVLTRDDLEISEIATMASATPLISHIEDAVGKSLKRSLAHGTTLNTGMLETPKRIRKGDNVTMIVQRGGLRVSMPGKALEDGAVGERINLNNTQSNRTVEGNVQQDGTIRVL